MRSYLAPLSLTWSDLERSNGGGVKWNNLLGTRPSLICFSLIARFIGQAATCVETHLVNVIDQTSVCPSFPLSLAAEVRAQANPQFLLRCDATFTAVVEPDRAGK